MRHLNYLLPALFLTACTTQPSGKTLYLLAGSYLPETEQSIHIYAFDTETGETRPVSSLSGVAYPTFFCQNEAGDVVYAVGEYDDADKATLNALHYDAQQGMLSLFSTQRNGAGAPCNITLHPSGSHLLCANYQGGSITTSELNEDGSLQPPTELRYEGTGARPDRQEKPHVHAVNFTPDGRYLLANDLGLDCIHIYPASPAPFDSTQGYDLKVDAGAGPRHLCFAPNGQHAYLISELSGQLFHLSYDGDSLRLVSSQIADTLQGGGSADIHVTHDGQFLYASHRLKGDGISIYRLDPTTGEPVRIGYQPTGIHPRNFTLSPDERFLLVACRDTDEIQVFSRDTTTGLLSDTGHTLSLPKPMFVTFLR